MTNVPGYEVSGILISKEDIDSLDRFYEKEFGQWVKDNYAVNQERSDELFWMMVEK